MGKFRKSIYIILFWLLSVQNFLYFQEGLQTFIDKTAQDNEKISSEFVININNQQKLIKTEQNKPCQAIKKERQTEKIVKDLSQNSMTYEIQERKVEFAVLIPQFCKENESGKNYDRLRAPPKGGKNKTQLISVSL